MTTTITASDGSELLPCPWCGGVASLEQCDNLRWSCGCSDEECLGYQSLTTFPRQYQAIAAWNRRAPTTAALSPAIATKRHAVHDCETQVAIDKVEPAELRASLEFKDRTNAQLQACIVGEQELRAKRDELLAALKTYVAVIADGPRDQKTLMTAIRAADENARAAIAKAEDWS